MKKSGVTIIIPTHNYARYLPDAVNSALRQDYEPLEIIVVDDGSTDNTSDVIKPFLSNEKIRYIPLDKKTGLSGARNSAIKMCTGDYLNCLDADDILEEGAIRAMVELMDRNPDSAMVVGRRIDFDEMGNYFILEPYFPGEMEKDTFKKLVYRDFICVSGSLLRKSCLEKTGLYNPEMDIYEDYDLYLRLAYYYHFVPLNKLVARKRFHNNNMTHPRNYLKILTYEIKALENVLKMVSDEKDETMMKHLEDAILIRKKWLAKESCIHGKYDETRKLMCEYIYKKGGSIKHKLISNYPRIAGFAMRTIKFFMGFTNKNRIKKYDSIPDSISRL